MIGAEGMPAHAMPPPQQTPGSMPSGQQELSVA
jgi:hypothetical protein